MKQMIKAKLLSYISENNPELIINLPANTSMEGYLDHTLDGIQGYLEVLENQGLEKQKILTLALDSLTQALRPSKYLYLKSLLEEEFCGDFLVLREQGTLTTELVNLITVCSTVFKRLGFSSETINDRTLRYAIVGQTREYLQATANTKN